MPFPASMTMISLHMGFDTVPDGGAAGTVRIMNKTALVGIVDDSIVRPIDIITELDANGELTISLPATNDPQWTPVDWPYYLQADIGGATIRGTFQLDYQQTTEALSRVIQLDGAGTTGVTYATLAQLGFKLDASQLGLLDSGEEAIIREIVGSEGPMESGRLFVTYFTARKSEDITKLFTGATYQAGGGTTLARIGVYASVAGTSTLIASTPNDTALWSGTFTTYLKSLSSTWSKVAGSRYGIGHLWVGAGDPPVLDCQAIRYQTAGPAASGGTPPFAPILQCEVAGQADLPNTIDEPAATNGYRRFQSIMVR